MSLRWLEEYIQMDSGDPYLVHTFHMNGSDVFLETSALHNMHSMCSSQDHLFPLLDNFPIACLLVPQEI